MNRPSIPPLEQIQAIAGHQFPGGNYRIEHWENFLLTDCTGAEILPGGMVHPVALFHVPIIGCGTSITEMFVLGQAESDLSIIPASYDWEIFEPLIEDISYSISGRIISAERNSDDDGNLYDRIQFCFEIHNPEKMLAVRSTITWHYTRNTL